MADRLWRVAFVAPAHALPAFERAIENHVDTLAAFDLEPEAASPGWNPIGWGNDLWQAEICVLEGVSQGQPDRAAIETGVALTAASLNLPLPEVTIEPVVEQDWLAASYRSFPPIRVGRFVVCGSHVEEAPHAPIVLRLDAATAFGTGEHGTTRGCLRSLDRLAKRISPKTILDLGCGSGILGLAAAKLWRRKVVGSDIDEMAVRLARVNARGNGAGDLFEAVAATGWRDRRIAARAPYDLVFANILARPLISMAPDLGRNLAPGGYAILSGFLERQVPAVLAAHRAQGLVFEALLAEGVWRTLVLRRP